ncbi:MAG: GNAT family N-acetyltransferase [Candidatus Hodarchaeota archaeon]
MIWVIDEIKNTPAGMGIAELDMTIPEASLEWIQVLPEYRNQGIGKAIVIELLNRYKDKVKFITVSGKVNNQTNPEELYKKCGFKGRDIWWVLSKRGG